MGRQFTQFKALTKIWILCPEGDEIKDRYQKQTMVYEGSEDDVLSRYVAVANMEKADYIVRVTGDCVELPSFMISRAIKATVKKQTDYTTNVIYRTSMEGFDVEVLSKRLLDWLDEHAEGEDREHVTTLIRKGVENNFEDFPFKKGNKPSICHIIDAYDLSFVKTSVDTEEDRKKTEVRKKRMSDKIEAANRNGVALTP